MAQLDTSGLTFTSQPTKAETERFEYAAFGYFDNNPAIVGNTYQSFIGVYYDDFGNKTDDYSQYDYLYMLLNYVQNGYVDIENVEDNTQYNYLYMLLNYVQNGYVGVQNI